MEPPIFFRRRRIAPKRGNGSRAHSAKKIARLSIALAAAHLRTFNIRSSPVSTRVGICIRRSSPTRYAAVYSFFLEGLDSAAARLKNFVEKAAKATLVGDVFDDAATGQGC